MRPSTALSLFTRLADPPRHSSRRSLAIVAITVMVIGWADYLTGNRISLELFYLVPITLCVAWLGPLAGCGVAFMAITARVIGDLANGPYPFPVPAFTNRVTDLGIYLVLVGVLHGLISVYREVDRRVAERTRALLESNSLRERLERELLDIASRERNAMGRELHDDLCQQLVGTAFAAKVLAENLAVSDSGAARDAQSIVRYLDEGIAKTRALARGLLLASIEPSALPDELAELAARSSDEGVLCRFQLEGQPAIGSAATAAQLLRIAQEATRNALRHAGSTHVDIVLAGSDGATVLVIEDDGRGLPPADARGQGMGLEIMQHRAALIGGALSIVPALGGGTCVICHLPQVNVASVT